MRIVASTGAAAGKTYRIALSTASGLRDHPHLTYASGGIGEQMAQLKRWLAARAQPGGATRQGVRP
jgi:hypothetical protein